MTRNLVLILISLGEIKINETAILPVVLHTCETSFLYSLRTKCWKRMMKWHNTVENLNLCSLQNTVGMIKFNKDEKGGTCRMQNKNKKYIQSCCWNTSTKQITVLGIGERIIWIDQRDMWFEHMDWMQPVWDSLMIGSCEHDEIYDFLTNHSRRRCTMELDA